MNKSGTDTEFEAKFYPVNKEEYRRKLKSVGAKLVIPERKMVRYSCRQKNKSDFGKKWLYPSQRRGKCDKT